jgi:phosphoribosylanthranilate isomerase
MKNKLKIKVCGMREPENIKDLISLHPDFIGFIFYEKSSRFIQDTIPDFNYGNSKKTGVFVNKTLPDLLKIAKLNKLDTIQLHGQESPEYCEAIQNEGFKVIKVFLIDKDFDFRLCRLYETSADLFLFDTKGLLPGGNGQTFNWDILSNYHLQKPFLLSGGIGLQHIDTLKVFSHPQLYGIDVNSGFETKPAFKNIDKLKTFFNEIQYR